MAKSIIDKLHPLVQLSIGAYVCAAQKIAAENPDLCKDKKRRNEYDQLLSAEFDKARHFLIEKVIMENIKKEKGKNDKKTP